MTSRPLALDATPSERRALRFKCFTFYGKWEPKKSIQDVNDLTEWALENGIAVFNEKLKAKYGEDLSSVNVNSYVDLPLETQLKLFYSEFDPNKPQKEIDDVAIWARQRGVEGVTEINSRMNKKYGENLNTMAFGGRIHLRYLLEAYFRKVDPLKNTPENINITIDFAVQNGALALMRELMDRYKTALQLSVQEIEGKTHEVAVVKPKKAEVDAPRPAVMSLMRGAVQPINVQQVPPPVPLPKNVRPLSAALSVASSRGPAAWSVSEDTEIKGLIEIFYAKNNPEKLSNGGVDQLMKYARMNGLEAVNIKLMDKYGEDLDTLKVQYQALIQQLVKYYAKVDPSKTNVEDIAAWAIVHGTQPLSERLEKRYGRSLFAEEDEQQLDPQVLRQRLAMFYQQFDKQPKSESDLDTIVAWVMAGSISQLNKKLKEKYGANLDDLPPLEVGERVEIPIARNASSNSGESKTSDSKPVAKRDETKAPETSGPKPEMLGTIAPPKPIQSEAVRKASVAGPVPTSAPIVRSNSKATPPGTPPRSVSPVTGIRERSDSFASAAGEDSMDKMEQQMTNMRRITSGQYDNLGLQLRAFYRRFDPAKLDNKESMDLIIKWTFKHGTKALNEKFAKHYGKSLDAIEIDDLDEEAEEGADYVPDW